MNTALWLTAVLRLVLIEVLGAGLFFVVSFVSIVWTHRPDLSVADIIRAVIHEIFTKSENN